MHSEDGGRTYNLNELIGEPVQIDANALGLFAHEDDFSPLAFELYKETAKVVGLCCHSFIGDEPGKAVLDRDQAICAGLLVRTIKFMSTVMLIVCSDPDREEVVYALNRCIMESAINLRFLVVKNQKKYYDEFVESSLGPERELYDMIMCNVEKRGGKTLPIEERMIDSINHVCTLSGLKIADVRVNKANWGGGLRQRLEAIGEGYKYVGIQRVPSHAIHGTWVDLVLNHLKEKDGGFVPDPSWSRVDARLILPICIVVLNAAYSYLKRFLGDYLDLKPVYERMANLQVRIMKVDKAHEALMESSQGPKGLS